MDRLTMRLPVGYIINDKYKIEERLSSRDETKDLRYKAFNINNPEEHVFIRELVFNNVNEKIKKNVIEPLEKRLLSFSKIEHPNIGKIIEIFSSDENAFFIYRLYIVTDIERATGKSLLKFLEEGEIKLEKIKYWGLQICSALSEIHKRDIVYYDLNPEYIIFTDSGLVKLYDFGCSRAISDNFSSNIYMGTPGYSAHEQYGIKPVDTRADIYGFGALLHHLITKEDPKKNPLKFSPVKKYNSSCPRDLAELVSTCLEEKADNRYQTIEDVLKKLDNVVFSSNTTTVSIKKREKTEHKEIKRKLESSFHKFYSSLVWTVDMMNIKYRKQLLSLSIVAVITLIVLIVFTYISSLQKNSSKIIILGTSGDSLISIDARNTGKTEKFNIKINSNGQVLLSKDGRHLYIPSYPDQLCYFDLQDNKIVTQVKVGAGPEGLALSPVRNYIAVAGSKSDTVSLIDGDYNSSVATLNSGGKKPVSLCFSSDGEKLFVLNKDSSKVIKMDLTGQILSSINIDGEGTDIINLNDKLYVSLWDKNEVLVIDGEKMAVTDKIKVGGGPKDLALYLPSSLIGVICQKSQEVYLISNGKISNKVSVANIPCSIVFSSEKKKVYLGTTTFDHEINNLYLWNTENNSVEKIFSSKMAPLGLVFSDESN